MQGFPIEVLGIVATVLFIGCVPFFSLPYYCQYGLILKLLGFSLGLDMETTSYQCSASCTGFQSRTKLTSNWCALSSRLCPSRHPVVPGWRRTPGLGRSSTSAAFVYRQIVCCSTHSQHVRQHKFCCRHATCVEMSPSTCVTKQSDTELFLGGGALKMQDLTVVDH